MVIRNPWENEDKSDLISISTHKLYISTSGPARTEGKAVVVFFTGGGAPAILYQPLQRLLSQRYRVYFYDRTGYNHSERGHASTLTAQDAAAELTTLLQRIGVGPPHILVGHSYGCILARVFLSQQPAGVVTGMVLAEAATELMFQLFPKFPDPSLDAVAAGVDFVQLTNLRAESGLTEDEWMECMQAVNRTSAAAVTEDSRGSALVLSRERQFQLHVLSPWPISVICCSMANVFRILYDAGVKKHQGTDEERFLAKAFIERVDLFEEELKASQLRLSTLNEFVHFPDRLHDDVLRRQGTIVDELDWITEQQIVVTRKERGC